MSSILSPSADPLSLTYDPLAVAERDDLLTARSAWSDPTFVIALYGELDLSTVEVVERHLRRAESSPAGEIVLDLSALHFVDSTGVRLIWRAERRIHEEGRRLVLLRGPDPVHRVFEVCGLADLLPFAD